MMMTNKQNNIYFNQEKGAKKTKSSAVSGWKC